MNSIVVRTIALISVSALTQLSGCGQSPKSTSSDAGESSWPAEVIDIPRPMQVPVTNQQQAIEIAKQYARLDITNVHSCQLSTDRWIVLLKAAREDFGAHATVQVATNGKSIRYVRGR
jgi:hypothetical protein